MRIGNLTQTVWKRSVKKQLHKRREVFLTEPLNGERCSAMKVDAQTSVVVAANASANGNTAKTAVYAAIRAVNDLACRGADPAGIRLQCFLPEAMTEEQFRDLIGEVEAFCEQYIYQATVDAMAKEGRPFTGVIFFGLMLTEDGPKVLEYNARFGDPEAQVVLPRMKNDIIDVMEACVDGTLDTIDLQFEDNACVCVVLASDGYPVKYEKGFKITGFEKFAGKEDYYCYHAGTKFDDDGNIVTNGGRVLGITATGATLKEARAKAYEATEWVQFDNKYMRHDIGKAIDEA